jgi:hypothetical protein
VANVAFPSESSGFPAGAFASCRRIFADGVVFWEKYFVRGD